MLVFRNVTRFLRAKVRKITKESVFGVIKMPLGNSVGAFFNRVLIASGFGRFLPVVGSDKVCHCNGFAYVIAYMVGTNKVVDTGMFKGLAHVRLNTRQHHMYTFFL